MIYIIISNIGLALITLIIYSRYSHFRITSNFKIRDLEKRVAREVEEKESLRSGLPAEVASQVEQVRQLLIGMDELRKEKEEESRLRLEAEKQIELALQKTQEIQKRMNDWKVIQDAAMQDSKEAILKVGNELYEKLIKNHEDQTLNSQAVIDKTVQNVYGYLDNISKNVESFRKKSDAVSEKMDRAVLSANSSMVKASPIQLDSVTKKMVDDVIDNIDLSDHVANKHYIAATTIADDSLKLLLCDVVFLKDDAIYLLDFKSNRYFQEYSKLKNSDKEAAVATLKQRLNKYVAYISNPKYSATLRKLAISLKMKFSDIKIVFVVGSKNEIAILKEVKYFDSLQDLDLTLLDLNGVNDLVL